MSISIDANSGDVIRVFLKHGKESRVGAVVSVNEKQLVLRGQSFIKIEVSNEDGKDKGFVENVTVDSADHLGMIIDCDEIYAWEPASFSSLMDGLILTDIFEFDEDLLGDIKKEIGECEYFSRQLHYYNKDGFCIVNARRMLK